MPQGHHKANSDKDPIIHRQKLPYSLDNGIGDRARIGLIVLPDDQTIEYELRMIFDLPGAAFFVNRLPCAPDITSETLKAMQSEIARSAGLILPGLSVDVMAYGCTSGSLFIGPATVHALIRKERPHTVCTTPIEAATTALETLNARKIALITPYADEINQRLRDHLRQHGFKVPVMGSWNEPRDAKVGRISPASIHEIAADFGRSELVDTVFISCTNLRALEILKGIESKLDKPVISSNQALGWHCLRLAGIDDPMPQFGRLFALSL